MPFPKVLKYGSRCNNIPRKQIQLLVCLADPQQQKLNSSLPCRDRLRAPLLESSTNVPGTRDGPTHNPVAAISTSVRTEEECDA